MVFNNLLYLSKQKFCFQLVLKIVAKNNSQKMGKKEKLFYYSNAKGKKIHSSYEFSIESQSKYEAPGLF